MSRWIRNGDQILLESAESKKELGTLLVSCGEVSLPVPTSVPAALGSVVAWARGNKTLT